MENSRKVMPLFDTHTHAYYEPLSDDAEGVISRMQKSDVLRAVQIGTDVMYSQEAIDLARKFPEHYRATVGYHPVEAQEVGFESPEGEKIRQELADMLETNRDMVVAVGETGVDRHYLIDGKWDNQLSTQEKWFSWHASLAQKYGYYLVIHSREAPRETIDWIEKYDVKKAIIHCFAENQEFAEQLMNFSDEIVFSFSGILTYKNAQSIQGAAAHLPLAKILIETDAPWLAPHSIRGKTNDSSHVREVFEKLCDLRVEEASLIENTLWKNSQRVFGWY